MGMRTSTGLVGVRSQGCRNRANRDQRAYERESEKSELYAQTTRLGEAASYLKQGTEGQTRPTGIWSPSQGTIRQHKEQLICPRWNLEADQ